MAEASRQPRRSENRENRLMKAFKITDAAERQAQLPRTSAELLWRREWKGWAVVKSGVMRLGVSCSALLALLCHSFRKKWFKDV